MSEPLRTCHTCGAVTEHFHQEHECLRELNQLLREERASLAAVTAERDKALSDWYADRMALQEKWSEQERRAEIAELERDSYQSRYERVSGEKAELVEALLAARKWVGSCSPEMKLVDAALMLVTK